MPESKPRKKPASTEPVEARAKAPQGNPPWLVPTMVSLLILGLLWVVVTYLFETRYPVPGLGNWNLAVGFAFLLAGMGLAMRWR